jgi:DNA-binding transcriptional ArsR family regulator
VSKHLAVLKLAGLVRDRHEGRQTHYSADGGTHVRMEQSGFLPADSSSYPGANYGWQKYFGGLERVAAGLE